MTIQRFAGVLLLGAIISYASSAQEVTARRVIGVTFNSPNAAQLSINRGRLIWRETDPNSSNYNLRYFSGAEVFLLDSNLTGVTSCIDGDLVVWSTASEELKMFNTRSWDTTWLGTSYNPGGTEKISAANGVIAFARRKSGPGSLIALHHTYGGTDTTFDEDVWNTSPTIHHDQVAWMAGPSESASAPCNIFRYDGVNARNISKTTGARNYSPLLRDGQVIWLQDSGQVERVKLLTRDSLVTVAETQSAGEIVVGHDASDGIALAAIADTSLALSRIFLYDGTTDQTTVLIDSNIIAGVHIDNGTVVWQSGKGPSNSIKSYSISSAITQSYGNGELPVVDDDELAWTSGDAVELDVELTSEQLTTDLQNGWEQSRFKPIDHGMIAFGNYDQSQHTRLYYSGASQTTQVADSSSSNDFVMANDGMMIWRENSDTLWIYNGSGSRVKLLDSLQVENMFLANGFISFNGFRLNGGGSILQAWLYDVAGRTLHQLTNEDTTSTKTNIVTCDGNSAVWNRDSSDSFMIMFFDGSTTRRLSTNDTVGFRFGYQAGIVVWSEVVNGVEQIMMYDSTSRITTQLTHANTPSDRPATDGEHVVWFSDFFTNPTMYYYDIATGATTRVAHAAPDNFRWPSLSNGKITFTLNGDVFIYDGRSISQLTLTGQFPPNKEAYVDNDFVVWNRTDPSSFRLQGNIFKGKLHAHPAFDARNVYGLVPLGVSFRNNSWEGMTGCSWDFGDGGTSTERNPTHMYLTPGRYNVTLTVTDPTGSREEKKIHLVNAVTTTGINASARRLPSTFALHQNYPNPFNPTTHLSFVIGQLTSVSLKVYDILGKEVATIVNERMQPGSYTRIWDARNVPSGVYTYRLTAGTFVEEKKMLLIR